MLYNIFCKNDKNGVFCKKDWKKKVCVEFFC